MKPAGPGVAPPSTTRSPGVLADCALREEESRGRRHAEATHPYRGEFQRDRDRIVHSRAFRRLENKTQVFSHRFSDHFRTRLTHTLEVAQVSRTVAQALGLNAELTEALALAHDLGHPPFGHAGEHALDGMMRSYRERFDHNLQALRIVEEIEVRYAAFPGLNLTFEVREGIVKHSRDYTAAGEAGSADLDLREYDLDLRPPLEAQLIDLTDEISYGAADLDDGFEAHLLSLEQIGGSLALFARLLEEVKAQFGPLPPKLRFNEALKRLMDYFISDLIQSVGQAMQRFGSSQAVRRHPVRIAGFSPKAEQDRRALKEFLYAELYHHPQLLQENQRAEQIVAEVFERYMRQPELLPSSYRERLAQAPRHRVVRDYLAGMTDSYILLARNG